MPLLLLSLLEMRSVTIAFVQKNERFKKASDAWKMKKPMRARNSRKSRMPVLRQQTFFFPYRTYRIQGISFPISL